MDRKIIEDFDRKEKSRKHKKKKDTTGSKSKQSKVEEPESVRPTTSYRDRAKERREGLNKDFELEPDDLRISNPTSGGNFGDEDDEQPLTEQERRLQQIEESKYLGGDLEHTHLVKGLDFALLEKVKNDQKLAEKLNNDKDSHHERYFGHSDSDSEEEEFRNEALLAAGSIANSKRQVVDIEKLKKGNSTEIIQCRTAIARRILNVLEEKWPEKSELFLPGRMIYSIPIDEDTDECTVTKIVRSKADTGAQEDGGALNESDLALDQLVNILAKIRKGSTADQSNKRTKNWSMDDKLNDYGY